MNCSRKFMLKNLSNDMNEAVINETETVTIFFHLYCLPLAGINSRRYSQRLPLKFGGQLQRKTVNPVR